MLYNTDYKLTDKIEILLNKQRYLFLKLKKEKNIFKIILLKYQLHKIRKSIIKKNKEDNLYE